MPNSEVAGVVVAAGLGQRLGSSRPKAFVEIDGLALYQWAARALRDGGCERIVIVAPPGQWQAQVADAEPTAIVVPGGDSRQQSVRLGLQALSVIPPEFVLIHDAARALTPVSVIERVIEALREGHELVAPAVPIADTVRQVDAEGVPQLLERETLRAVQTPQGCNYQTLVRAHAEAAASGAHATDDVTLCERHDRPVWLVEGDAAGFKITTTFDLAVALTVAR